MEIKDILSSISTRQECIKTRRQMLEKYESEAVSNADNERTGSYNIDNVKYRHKKT